VSLLPIRLEALGKVCGKESYVSKLLQLWQVDCSQDRRVRERAMKKAGSVVGGWFAIGLGVAGLALPFPGMMLILLGLVILSSHYVWAERALGWLRNKFPKTTNFADLHWANLRNRFSASTSR
jgi:hypothetical protein